MIRLDFIQHIYSSDKYGNPTDLGVAPGDRRRIPRTKMFTSLFRTEAHSSFIDTDDFIQMKLRNPRAPKFDTITGRYVDSISCGEAQPLILTGEQVIGGPQNNRPFTIEELQELMRRPLIENPDLPTDPPADMDFLYRPDHGATFMNVEQEAVPSIYDGVAEPPPSSTGHRGINLPNTGTVQMTQRHSGTVARYNRSIEAAAAQLLQRGLTTTQDNLNLTQEEMDILLAGLNGENTTDED